VIILPHLLYVRDIGGKCDVFGLHPIGRPATPALVVIDQMEPVGEAVHLRQKIAVVKIGSTMENNDCCAPSDFSGI
jgi:hypothetical protein